ncbi:MAG: HAD family hydrolase [Bacillota bacterium]
MRKYKCLITDHDDTAVHSTAEIHYPAYLEAMRVLRPDCSPLDLDEYFIMNFHPGFMTYLRQTLGFSDEEVEKEYRIWRRFTEKRIPTFYPGFLEFLKLFRAMGGLVAVVSHSEAELIRRDYRAAEGNGFMPDLIFGWECDETKCKPHPYPVREILKFYGLNPQEALILDDLKPGYLMSQACGVDMAGAGWGHRISEIERYMRENCNHYFATVEELRDFML